MRCCNNSLNLQVNSVFYNAKETLIATQTIQSAVGNCINKWFSPSLKVSLSDIESIHERNIFLANDVYTDISLETISLLITGSHKMPNKHVSEFYGEIFKSFISEFDLALRTKNSNSNSNSSSVGFKLIFTCSENFEFYIYCSWDLLRDYFPDKASNNSGIDNLKIDCVDRRIDFSACTSSFKLELSEIFNLKVGDIVSSNHALAKPLDVIDRKFSSVFRVFAAQNKGKLCLIVEDKINE